MKKISLFQIGFEFVSVVFAVLLALGLNSYKEKRDMLDESKTIRLKILAECKSNLAKIDSVISTNAEFENYLDSVIQVGSVEGFSFSFENEFLSSSVWKSAQNARSFHYLDSYFIDQAAETYELQEYYSSISNQMLQFIGEVLLQVDEKDPITLARVSQFYLSNTLTSAKALKEAYTDFVLASDTTDPGTNQ